MNPTPGQMTEARLLRGPGARRETGGPGRTAPRRDAAALARLLERQRQVITRRQAIACGLNHDMIQRRICAGGQWQRLLPGVYLALTGTPTQEQGEVAALLYAGPGSIITGAAALRRHGLRAPRAGAVDVLIPGKRRRQNAGYVAVHPTMRIPPSVCYQGPVQYALAARAVADATRCLDDLATVRAVVASAVQTRQCTIEQLAEELRQGPKRGSALLRTALREVAQGARSASEADVLALIKRAQLPTPLLNPRLYLGDELLGVPDAWWPEAGVAVEVDSREWHLSPQDWERTIRRHARMTAVGILVLHFTPRQLKDERDEVVRTIRATLDNRRGCPVPAIRNIACHRLTAVPRRHASGSEGWARIAQHLFSKSS
jgi:hypothetical protein